MRRFEFFGSYNSFIGLLDLVPEASVCFSLIKMRSNYSGPCVKILRNLDNATLDVGFVNNELDVVSLMNFIGSDTGYVLTWYDQSENGNHASQDVKIHMPILVNGGVLEVVNWKPALRFSGNQLLIMPSDVSNNFENSRAFIGKKIDNLIYFGLNRVIPNGDISTLILYNNYIWSMSNNQRQLLYDGETNQHLFYSEGGFFEKLFKNNTDISVAPDTISINNIFNMIGSYTENTPVRSNGYKQVITHWNRLITPTEKSEVHNILNDYYAIY